MSVQAIEYKVKPFFSIVIPCYNSAATMERTLQSCLAQSFADFEIVIIDDGSKDDIEALVSTYTDGRITFYGQANAGGGAARNRGAEMARGDYIAFLDSDDAFLPGKLQAFYDAIQAAGDDAHVSRKVWYAPLYFYRSDANRMVKPDRAIAVGEPVGDYLFCADGMMQTSTLVIPRAFFQQVRFNPSLPNLQDLDLCLRLEAAGASFQMLSAPQTIWYDDGAVNRVSYRIKTDHILTWADAQRERLSPRAYHGFLARYLVPAYIRRQPMKAMAILNDAMAAGALSRKRAASLLARGAMPVTYRRLRDHLVSRSEAKALRQSYKQPRASFSELQKRPELTQDFPRVLHVTEAPLGGVVAYLEEMLESQVTSGSIDVALVTPQINMSALERVQGAHFTPVIVSDYSRKSLSPPLRLAWQTIRHARRTRPEILHVHSTIAGAIVRACRPFLPRETAVIYCPHGWAFSREGSGRSTKLVIMAERLLSRGCDSIVCISEHERAEAIRAGIPAGKLTVIENGVSPRTIALPSPAIRRAKAPRRIIFAGRFDRQKGFDTYLNVMRRLGDEAEGLAIGQQIVSSGTAQPLPPNVSVTGWIAREKVYEHYANADLLLMPSRWEGFGLVAVEAMQARLPVFSSRVGGLQDIVIDKKTGRLFEPHDVDFIVEHIRATSDAQLRAYGRAGYERYLQLYTAERMNRQMLTHYAAVSDFRALALQHGGAKGPIRVEAQPERLGIRR